jgi:hypothetical protein
VASGVTVPEMEFTTYAVAPEAGVVTATGE